MKTSIKLLLTALLVVLVALFAYDLMVRTEYQTGAYKNPYRYYVDLKFKDFDTININSSTAANVRFEQGPYRIRVNPDAMGYTKISQKNGALNINAVFKHGYEGNRDPYLVIISCPKIAYLKINAQYIANGGTVTDSIAAPYTTFRPVLINGFKQDSLAINGDYGSRIILSNNKIGVLNATSGLSKGSGSELNILSNNQFGSINVNINNKSKLILDNVPKNKFIYKLADSATMVLSGAAQDILKKQ